MAKTTQPTADTPTPPTPWSLFDTTVFADANKNALRTWMDSGAKLVGAGSAVNAEVVEFVGRRLEKDAAIGECLIDCRSLDEVYEVYADFLQTSAAEHAGSGVG